MPGRTYLGLCAIAKDEDTIVREWVAYHHSIGFERIFIYDNGSKAPIRNLVADFYDQGVVETYTIPGETMQLGAYNHFLKHHGHEFVWTAFFDLDEFLLLLQDKDARPILAEYERYPCISVNWGPFGSAGHLKRPEGLVIESFTEAFPDLANTKCIVQPCHVTMPLSPHHFVFNAASTAPHMRMYAVNTREEPAVGAYVPLATERMRLNHYPFRSQEDYEARLARGDAVYAANPRSLEHFYLQAAQPGQHDDRMVHHADTVATITRTGKITPYCPVESQSISLLTLPEILQNMVAALRRGYYETAFVIFSVTFRLFADDEHFVNMGIRLALLCKRYIRAEYLARHLISIAPTLASYQQLLAVQIEHADPAADRTGAFIVEAAGYMNDPAAAEAVRVKLARFRPS